LLLVYLFFLCVCGGGGGGGGGKWVQGEEERVDAKLFVGFLPHAASTEDIQQVRGPADACAPPAWK
jgi:hypothetical protein